MTELVKSLGIDWPVMVAQLVNFAILLLILLKFVYKPVMKMLDERRDKIAEAAKKEEKISERLSGMEAERQKLLAEARADSQRIIEEAKKGGEEVKKKMLVTAQEEAARWEKEAGKRLADKKTKLVADVKREIGTLVVDAIERSFGDALDAKSQGKMVEQALAAIREQDVGTVKSKSKQ